MIRYIISFALNKPILNHLLLLFLLLLSVFSYFNIPKEIFPPSKMQAISIDGNYAGASSELLDKIVVEDLEDDLGQVSDVSKISSTIKNGFFTIVLELKKDVNVNDVIFEVKDIVSKSKKNLPSDMDEPTISEVIYKIPLITVVLSSKLEKEKLLVIAKDVKRDIIKLKDLSEVEIWGDSSKELEIVFNEKKIDAYGLNLNDVITAVQNQSSIFPLGVIKDSKRHYYLSTYNGEKELKVLENSLITMNNLSLRLKDIAKLDFTLDDNSFVSHFNGVRDISIGINKSASGDAIYLAQEIKKILKNYGQKYPDIVFDTHTDTSVWIKNRLNTVVSNILFGLCLLFIALLFFINARIAIVIAIGIPTSFMIALIVINAYGYSINMLSLLGALLALGMLVDEAIVVGENIYRHLEMGKNRFDAALDGALEVYPAVLTATATTICAFLPILLMTGETGKFMKILPVIISILLLASLLEAFFFLPLHAKELYKVHTKAKKSDIFWIKSKIFYKKVLNYLLKKRFFGLISMVVIILSLIVTFAFNSKFTLMPEFDNTQIFINGSVGVGAKLSQTEELVSKIEQKILKEYDFSNNVASISSVIGLKLDGQNQAQFEEFYFQIFVNLNEHVPANVFDKYINPYLSPKYDDSNMLRTTTAQNIQIELSSLLKEFTLQPSFKDLNIFVPQAGIIKNDFELSLSGNSEEVKKALVLLKNKLSSLDGVTNISDDVLEGNLEIKLRLNNYGKSLSINESYLSTQLKPLYLNATYSKMFDKEGLVDIVFKGKNKDIFSSLESFEIKVPYEDKKVLLKEIVSFHSNTSYSQIFKENSLRIISLSASLSKITSSEVYSHLESLLEDVGHNVSIKIKGEEEENIKVIEEMIQSVLIAVTLIFISLVWMFNSLIKPLIIISTIPLSLLGVIVGHNLLGMNITMPSLIGVVGLAGVIVNDGIIMMDFIKKAKTLEELEELALTRLRPILLTSLTTILGLSTLIFFASGQALILQPMAVSLGFGVLWATVLNLYYVPMLYRLVYLRKAV